MSDQPCHECPNLRSQVEQLKVELRRTHDQLNDLRADVSFVLRTIHNEQERPSMARVKLIDAIQDRLAAALEALAGRRWR